MVIKYSNSTTKKLTTKAFSLLDLINILRISAIGTVAIITVQMRRTTVEEFFSRFYHFDLLFFCHQMLNIRVKIGIGDRHNKL